MSDNLPVVWPADPHTLAKHAILNRYLGAWMAILSRHQNKVPGSKRILYIDGFAGPGIYVGGEPGSPIIALKAALEHRSVLPIPVRFLFIENDGDRCASLKQQVDALRNAVADSPNVEDAVVKRGDCTTVLSEVVKKVGASKAFGPAMVFLDQFGWSQIPIDLVRDILRWPKCEVFSYLNWERLNQFMGDKDKTDSISRAYGSDAWKAAIAMSGSTRRAVMLQEYKKALQQNAKAKFVIDFAMYGDRNTLLYWLFFCTNNLSGVMEMKKAMWSVDSSGEYRFSDKDDPAQLHLLNSATDDWLATELRRRLAGRVMTVNEVRQFVLIDTPCYKFKPALKKLEEAGDVWPADPAPPNRKPGTYPDRLLDMRLQFRDLEV